MEKQTFTAGARVRMSAQNHNTPVLPYVSPKVRGKAGVFFGEKNMFPQDIINFTSKSPIQGSIIKSTAVYVRGKGINRLDGRFVGAPNPEYNYEILIERTAVDYKTFGGFAWQIIPSKDGKSVHIFHQDFSEVRALELDKTGNRVLTWGISKNWKNTAGKFEPVKLPTWQGLTGAKKEPHLFVFWDYHAGMTLYTVPDWFEGIDAVRTDGNLGVFWFNSVSSGFAPSAVVALPTPIADEAKRVEFEHNVRESLAGSDGAGSIAFLYGSLGGSLPQITPFEASKNADMYNRVNDIVFQRIVTANRLSSPTLAGLSGSGNLSGNAQEIIDAYILYSYTVIDEYRRTILNELNSFVKLNNIEPLEILELDVVQKIKEANGVASSAGVTTSADNTQIAPTTLSKESKFWAKLKNYLAKWKQR